MISSEQYGIRGYVWHTLPEAIIFYDCTALARPALWRCTFDMRLFSSFALNRSECSHARKRRPRSAWGRGREEKGGGPSYYNFIIITTFIAYSLLMAFYKVISPLQPLRNKFLLKPLYLFKLY